MSLQYRILSNTISDDVLFCNHKALSHFLTGVSNGSISRLDVDFDRAYCFFGLEARVRKRMQDYLNAALTLYVPLVFKDTQSILLYTTVFYPLFQEWFHKTAIMDIPQRLHVLHDLSLSSQWDFKLEVPLSVCQQVIKRLIAFFLDQHSHLESILETSYRSFLQEQQDVLLFSGFSRGFSFFLCSLNHHFLAMCVFFKCFDPDQDDILFSKCINSIKFDLEEHDVFLNHYWRVRLHLLISIINGSVELEMSMSHAQLQEAFSNAKQLIEAYLSLRCY